MSFPSIWTRVGIKDRIDKIFSDLTDEQQDHLMQSFIARAGYILQPAPTGYPTMQQETLPTNNNPHNMPFHNPTN
jgi:hypothetical protein